MINFITTSTKNPLYIDGGGNLSVRDEGPILGVHNPHRPIMNSELQAVLEGRQWHRTDRVYLDQNNNLWKETLDGGRFQVSGKTVNASTMAGLNLSNVESTLHASSEITFDLQNNNISFDLVDFDEYTSTVSLEKIRSKGEGEIKVDVSIKYTIGEDVYAKDITFKDGKDRIFPIEGDKVVLECVGGILKVMPISDEVGECIISNCIVTYGKL